MIPFIDLGAQYQRIQDDVEAAVLRVMRSGQYVMGPEVEALEQSLSDFVGVRHAITCASGTDALVIALMANGVGPSDAVFTTPFTFFASAEAISLVGATPVFVDVDATTFNMDPTRLSEAVHGIVTGGGYSLPAHDFERLTPRGVIAVDLFGLPADYAAISAIADAYGLFVIEDAAQSFGGSRGNRRAGSLAPIGCTSFFPAKPLGCFGDGGALFTNDDEMAALFKSIRLHGQGSDRYDHARIGLTGRLDAIQAAILNVKLSIFENELIHRQRVADRYSAGIQAAGLPLKTPNVPEGYRSAWAQYTVLAQSSTVRSKYQEKLETAGIPSGIYYPKPLHLQTAYARLGHTFGQFPVAEYLSERVFSLPMHPYLDDQTIDKVIGAMAS